MSLKRRARPSGTLAFVRYAFPAVRATRRAGHSRAGANYIESAGEAGGPQLLANA